MIAQATGNSAVGYGEMVLAAWRGQEPLASELIERMVQAASARGLGRMVDVATYAKATLYNGIGRYEAAREAARAAFEHRDHLGIGPFVVGELAEAASRTGDQALVEAALDWISERTRVTRTDWVLGDRGPRPRAAERRRRRRARVPRVDRVPRAHAPAPRARARAPALRRVAAPRGPPRRRARAAAHRPRDLRRDRRGRLRRTRATRAAGDRRDGPQAPRRHAR